MSLSAVTLINMVNYRNGGCGQQIHFTHRNYLTFHEKLRNNLVDVVKMTNPDILIISAGAWLKDKGDMVSILQSLSIQIESIKQYKQNITIIWRSQIPGHYDCTRDLPLKPFQFNTEDKYKWNYFPLFDNLARKSSAQMGIDWLDLSPLYMRSDSHPSAGDTGKPDCLHFCLPGPLDLFPILLLQKLYLMSI